MKRYKVDYWDTNKSKPYFLTELYKSGKWNGNTASLTLNGKKTWQCKYKNDLIHGLYKEWKINLRNIDLQNWKKNTPQGIQIVFK